MKYWLYITGPKAPPPARAAVASRIMYISWRLSVMNDRLAISMNRISVTHWAAGPRLVPAMSPM
ncbi:MAG: hypothetical protein BWY73_00711 [candidate division TA06 bacterium ADurb.Bin417]|uniref:Uncharacterized protein n=1 Tax=candidate division TA06 bacterium ADurb.Bin417 TaxID=1852828 RepID=A0A1V5MHB8_UNCT6|nr:MAG: hypothetical protein BWY73_00711 [candidate division TA06 bacterium ADurb.Bin417]